jgi:hypothetical protein
LSKHIGYTSKAAAAASRFGRVTGSFTTIGVEPAVCAGHTLQPLACGASAVRLVLPDLTGEPLCPSIGYTTIGGLDAHG